MIPALLAKMSSGGGGSPSRFNPLVIVASLLGLLFGLWLFFDWRKKKKEEAEKANPANESLVTDPLKPKSTTDAVWESVKNSTRDIAHNMGYIYSWYDPRRWSENDAKVAEILKYQVYNLSHMEKLYYEYYAKGRNLKSDIYASLDGSNLQDVKEFYKKKGKTI